MSKTEQQEPNAPNFLTELSALINRYNQEQFSNTPDFILGSFMLQCLRAFEAASRRREDWYGKTLEIDTGSKTETTNK